jgi:anti-sigma B factor antagonist
MSDLDAGGAAIAMLTRSSDEGGMTTVAISGELDISNADELRKQFEPILASMPTSLILDVSELSFMDSSGIALLVQVATQINSVTLRNPTPLIHRVLDATGVSTLLGVKP